MSLPEDLKPSEDILPKEVSGKEVLKGLSDLLNDEEARKEFLKRITGVEKRPSSWSKRSNSPYYKERFAKELKFHIDEMIADQQDRLYRYEDFNWLSKNSLYLMLNQAFRYLLDHLDPEGKYATFRQMISITREKDSHGNGKGIRMSIAKDVRTGLPTFNPRKVSDLEQSWREDMENFIEESANGQVFSANDLALSPEEVLELKMFLEQFPDIGYNVTQTQLKLVKDASLCR